MDNPRKKLYNSLVTSKDFDVKKHFSQWSEDEFDKKLSEDKEFQKDLFLDLKDIGLAKDEATFAKDYFSAPPTSAPAAAPAAAPVEKPVVPVKEKSTSGGSPILNFNQLVSVAKGVSGLYTTIKQMVGLKSEDQKYEENKKKREAGSVSGFAGNDELGKLGLYETAATEYRKRQKQKEQAEKPMISGAFGETAVYATPSGQAPEDKKAYEKSRQEYEKLFSEASPIFKKQAQAAVEKAKNDPTAYKKDKYGIVVPDPLWVAKEARDIATKAGAPAGGYAENFLQSNIEAALTLEQKAPELKEEADKLALKKYGKKMSDLYSEEVYKTVEPVKVHQDRLKAAAKKVKQTISAEYNPKIDAVNNEYNSFVANYKASLANDPSIKQAVDEYDAKSIAALEKGIKDGVLTPDEANAMLRSKSSIDARNTYINGVVDQKYGPELKTKYNKYLSEINVLNNRRNARLRRQYDELEEYHNDQYKSQIEIAKKTYKISPERAKLLQEIQEQAYDNVMGKEMEGKRRYDISADIWENFMSSSLKGLGEGIQSTAFTLGMEDVASFGNLLAKNFETSDLNINSWSDVGFGQEGRTKFAMSAGNIFGRMSPGLAASAGVAAATGGMGLSTLPSMLLAGVPSAAFETADIMGSIEQQMLSQSNGDIAKAQQAGSRALESQLKIWPTYLLDGLPFFPKILKFAGKSRYAGLNILTRGFAGGAINLVTETAQEVPQNVFEEIILADKDPTFSELYKNTTAEKIANTSASVVSMSLLMGSAPQVMDASQDAIAKRAAAGYYAKQVLNEASHPGLMVENQSQFIIQLADQKDTRFAAQMINILFQKGNIDKARAEVLARKLDNYERFKETEIGKSKNKIFRQAGFILYDRYVDARNSKNKVAEEAALKALQEFATTGNAELVMLGTPDGSFNVYTYDDLNSLMADEDFQKASREKNDKYGALFTVTPLIQTQEGLQNPKLQELLQRFENIQNSSEELDTSTKTSDPQLIDDEKILAGQKRAGVEAPKLFEIIPVEAAAVVDAIRSGEEGVTLEEINGASNIMYQIHKMYQKMRISTTRNLTLAQIDNITSDLEQAITELESQKTRLTVGDEQMDLLQQEDSESNQTIDAATQAAETQQEEAPTEETPLATETAPAETPESSKPKAKINLYTDEDVKNSFTQKDQELYGRLIFNGEEDLAKQMLERKRRVLIGREIEQVQRGEISEKVKAFYEKFGIGIELLSADDFVRVLQENGESASRGQEGVFDDKNGKIYINKDSFDTGFGTTVVWHEAVHPIMNIIHNSNKPLYDKIHRGILASAKANPEGSMASIIKDVERLYTNAKGYNDASRKDEIIVETIARLSAGTMSFNELQPTLRQQIKDLINRIGKILGLTSNDIDNDNIKALKDLAKKITAEINKGGEGNLSAIVGLENVGKTQRPGELSNAQMSIDGRLSERGLEVPSKEKLPKKISPSAEEKTLQKIDDLLDKYPNALTDRNEWKELMSRVFSYSGPNGEVYIPAFPEGLARMAKSPKEVLKELQIVSDEQRRLASEGIKKTKEIGELFERKEMDEVDTGLYFLWNIMSIGISPYPQEAGFLRAVNNGIHEFIEKAADGTFLTGEDVTITDIDEDGEEKTMVVDRAVLDYYDWVDETLVKDTPGSGAKANLRAFGRSFLSKASEKITSGEFAGKTRLQALHEILSDRKTSTNKLRRKWQANMSAMSFNNKIFDFILLTTGRSDLFVIDRVRTEHFWDAKSLKKNRGLAETTSIYDGKELKYGKSSAAGYSKMLSDVAGLVFAELANRTMQPLVKKAYEKLGVKDSPDVGRFHWETWVAASSQEVSHGSIDAIVQRKKAGEITDAGIRQGKYGSWDFNFSYRKLAGEPFRFEFKDDSGNTYIFDNISEIQDEIDQQNNKKTYSNSDERFILKDEDGKIIKRQTKDIDKPWYEQEGVDKQKYFDFLRSKAKEVIPAPNVIEDQGVVIGMPEETGKNVKKPQASLGGRQNAPSFSELDEVLDMSPVKSRAAREKLVEQYGKETVDKMIEISRNFEKIINDLEEREVVKKDCP